MECRFVRRFHVVRLLRIAGLIDNVRFRVGPAVGRLIKRTIFRYEFMDKFIDWMNLGIGSSTSGSGISKSSISSSALPVAASSTFLIVVGFASRILVGQCTVFTVFSMKLDVKGFRHGHILGLSLVRVWFRNFLDFQHFRLDRRCGNTSSRNRYVVLH